MLVARRANNHRIGLAVYLLEILCNFRLAEFGHTMVPIEIDMNEWELITTAGEINSRGRKLDRNTLWQALLNSGNSVDVDFIKYIDSKMYDSSGKFVPRYEKLHNGLCLADKANCKDATVTDTCWVIDYERDNHTSTNGYYAHVGKEMAAASITNLEEATAIKTFSGSSIPITVDKASYDDNYNMPPINYKCHHPFFCELNDNCRGLLKKPNGVSSWLTHCCIRPSHLVCLNKCFNDMNVVLQRKFDEPAKTFEYKKLSSRISW
jgi:hypothetical protein